MMKPMNQEQRTVLFGSFYFFYLLPLKVINQYRELLWNHFHNVLIIIIVDANRTESLNTLVYYCNRDSERIFRTRNETFSLSPEAVDFLISWATVSFLRRAELHVFNRTFHPIRSSFLWSTDFSSTSELIVTPSLAAVQLHQHSAMDVSQQHRNDTMKSIKWQSKRSDGN
jgi:hypothetical protein